MKLPEGFRHLRDREIAQKMMEEESKSVRAIMRKYIDDEPQYNQTIDAGASRRNERLN
jgi:hypothetical protein